MSFESAEAGKQPLGLNQWIIKIGYNYGALWSVFERSGIFWSTLEQSELRSTRKHIGIWNMYSGAEVWSAKNSEVWSLSTFFCEGQTQNCKSGCQMLQKCRTEKTILRKLQTMARSALVLPTIWHKNSLLCVTRRTVGKIFLITRIKIDILLNFKAAALNVSNSHIRMTF